VALLRAAQSAPASGIDAAVLLGDAVARALRALGAH
jgi:hypothetical protein